MTSLIALVTVLITAVPTPGGVVSSKWRDGNDGTAAIPLVWGPILGFVDKPDGTVFAVDLRQYLTEPGTPNATLSLVGSVANWSLSTDTLSYDGTGVSSGTLIARATRNADVSDSLPFAVSSIAVDTGPDCIVGFTCAAVDGGTCEFADVGGDQRITATGGGACVASKSFASEENRHFVIRTLGSPTWGDNTNAGGGIYFADGTDWVNSYRSVVWFPQSTPIKFRTNANDIATLNQNGSATTLPIYQRFVYNASNDNQSADESANGSSWTQIGNAVNDGPKTSGVYGMWAKAHGGTATTMTFEVITDSTTLPAGTPDPPDPPTGPLSSNYDGGPPWATGFGQIGGSASEFNSNVSSAENWLNYQMDVYVCWVSQSGADMVDWSTWRDQITTGSCTTALAQLPQTTTLVVSYPMFPRDVDPGVAGAQNTKDCANLYLWDKAAAGDFDAYLNTLAVAIRNQYVAARPNDPTGKLLVWRYGWEMSGCWYSWSVGNKVAEFHDWWERTVNRFRVELPDIKFAFSPARTKPRCGAGGTMCNPRIQLSEYVPDPAYYDVLMRSIHNENEGEVTSLSDFVVTHVDSDNNNWGLTEVCDFAVADGKKCGSDEWGSNLTGANASCGHIPSATSQEAFTQGTHNFFMSRPNDIAWEANLATACQGYSRRQSSPGGVRYKLLWGD